jgi:pteridine reductase
MEIRGRAALVTGGGVRVGRVLALGLAREGARVVVHHNSSAGPASGVVREIRDQGGEAASVGGDLSLMAELGRVAEEAEQAFGGIDILVNNASVFPEQRLEQATPELWDHTLAVNLRAPFFLIQKLAAGMRQRGGGVVVNLADLAGLQAWAGYVVHAVSKAGLVHLTRVAARSLAPHVRVNAIAPGTVLPPENLSAEQIEGLARRTPLRRIGDPQDVLDALLYLVRADFVTGEVLVVDGGRLVG